MANTKTKIFTLACVTVASLWLQWDWLHATSDFATVSFLDVGQGDAIYINTMSNLDIVMDGGPDDLVVSQLGAVMPFWDRTIELLILSHPDADHITGVVPLFEYYTIEKIVLVDVPIKSAVHQELYNRLEAHGTEIVQVFSGDVIQLSEQESLQILHPFLNDDLTKKETNDTGIVAEYLFKGSQQDTTILLTGDIGEAVEKELLNHQLINDVDILKVPHHGSHSSSSAEFIAATAPEHSIIQSGADNRYGHPHADVVERLQSVSTILRNDQLGAITFHINNGGYALQE